MARWSQAMVAASAWTSAEPWAPARLQLYVDDPAIVAWGTPQRRATTFGLMVLWWLVLGIPLSWKKGAVHDATTPYTWIGVLFSVPAPGIARMTLPAKFVDDLLGLCRAFLAASHLPLSQADALVGKAGRVAYVLPLTRPFVATLFAALAASLRARAVRAREAPPKDVACRRFQHGAQWLVRILGFADRRAPIPHSRDIAAAPPKTPDPGVRRIEVDASPWGAAEFSSNTAAR